MEGEYTMIMEEGPQHEPGHSSGLRVAGKQGDIWIRCVSYEVGQKCTYWGYRSQSVDTFMTHVVPPEMVVVDRGSFSAV